MKISWKLKWRKWWRIKLYEYRQFYCIYKSDDIYKDIADVETRFNTSNHELDHQPLAEGKHKKALELMKDD